MTDPRDRFVRWLLLEGDRTAVALGLSAAIFAFVVTGAYAGLLVVDDPAAVRGVAGGMIPGLFTFLSIVLAINQLVLSQQYGSADEVRERVHEIRGFRHDVEAAASTSPSPVIPTEFLSTVLQTLVDATAGLESDASDGTGSGDGGLDPEARDAIDRLAEAVRVESQRAQDVLADRDRGRVNALLPVLEYPASGQLYTARSILASFGGDLPDETHRSLTDLVEALELFGVARTHFRTTYTQRVLARLSRLLLYVGVPALLAAATLHMLPTAAGPAVVDRLRIPLVGLLFTIAFSPLSVLFAYLLRIATVSERTIAVGPFVSRPDELQDR